MPAFLYRCPNTGLQVQTWAKSDDSEDDRTYETVTCLACNGVHLVNLKTGKTVGEHDED